jgi:hypothetical protein
MRRTAAILFLLILAPCLHAQDADIWVKGDFQDVPFPAFVEKVEEGTGLSFYYLEPWIRGIRITATGDRISLSQILDKALLPVGIYYHMDAYGHIFLSPEGPLITRLPAYSDREAATMESVPGLEEELTEAEQKYINGRKAGFLETLVVGTGGEGAGRNAVINGKISDAETGEAVIGATIYFQELKKGAATDVDGRFSIVVPRGRYTVDFNCMGMETLNYYLQVRSSGNLSVSMDKSLIPLTEVTIQADRYHNVRGTQMGFDRLNYKVLKEVPVVMGEKDVLKIVQMLPGVQSVGEGAAGFNVRGSSADQNMIYVNKVPVYNSNHLFGFFTSFSPDIVRDFTLYRSNLPASFGGRLASFFDISTRQGNMNKFTARGGISPVTGHVAVEGPVIRDKSSFVLSARSTYSDWILKRLEDPDLRESKAGFYDLAGAYTWEAGEKTLVKVFAYLSKDHFNLGETNDYAYENSGASINLRRRFSTRSSGELALVYGSYQFWNAEKTIASEAYEHDYRVGHYELKADLNWLSMGKHLITYGGSLIYYDLDRGKVTPYGPDSYHALVDLGQERGVEAGVYLADEIALSAKLTLYGGLRYAAYLDLGPGQTLLYQEGLPLSPGNESDTLVFGAGEVEKYYGGPEPRVSLNYLTGENSSLKASYNRVRQFLFMLSNTIAISPTDQWKLCDYHIVPPYVDQVSLGYYQDFPNKSIHTSVELYHKWVHNVVEYRDGASFISTPYIETQTLQGEQTAYGVEAMVRKNTGKLNGWVSYSYSRSFVTVDSPIPGESINEGKTYPSNYDRPHNLNIVATYKLNRRLSVSGHLSHFHLLC